jgi:hypothetical protein
MLRSRRRIGRQPERSNDFMFDPLPDRAGALRIWSVVRVIPIIEALLWPRS